VSFAAVTLCVASQRVFIFVGVYFVIDSVRKLLDTPSYNEELLNLYCINVRKSGTMKVRRNVCWEMRNE
jgi:hypothetical protein